MYAHDMFQKNYFLQQVIATNTPTSKPEGTYHNNFFVTMPKIIPNTNPIIIGIQNANFNFMFV